MLQLPAVIDTEQIVLQDSAIGTHRFKVRGGVRPHLLTQFPPKVTTGDFSRISDPLLSGLAISDFRGGWLQERYDPGAEPNHVWWSTNDGRFANQLQLNPYADTATTGLPAVEPDVEAWTSYNFTQYTIVTRKLYRNDGAGGFTSLSLTFAGTLPAVDACTGESGGRIYALYAQQDGYVRYDQAGGVHEQAGDDVATPKAILVVPFDQTLWAMNGLGKLWKATNLAADTWDATQGTLVAPNVAPPAEALVVYRDRAGDPRIHVIGLDGLYIYDDDAKTFYRTDLVWPYYFGGTPLPYYSGSYNQGRPAVVWRGSLYIAVDQTVYEYTPTSVTNIGFSRGDGLPFNYLGPIRGLVNADNWLIAYTSKDVFAWDGVGWHWLYGGPAGNTVRNAWAGTVTGGKFELWVAGHAALNPAQRMELPRGTFNPRRRVGYAYAPTGETVTPWYTAGWDEVKKLFRRVTVEGLQITAGETITFYYQLDDADDDDPWLLIGGLSDLTGNGPITFDLAFGAGLAAIRIRFKIVLQRVSAIQTPILLYLVLTFRPLLPIRYSYGFTVDLTEEGYDGKTCQEQSDTLQHFVESEVLVQFGYRREGEALATDWVQVSREDGTVQTGVDTRGVWELAAVQL